MCDPQALREALQFSARGEAPFAEAVVNANLVSDWELSRVVCEIYSLPFLTVEMYEPDPAARKGLNTAFLIEHGLVPLGRFGQLLTIVMPGMVPADVLALLSAESDLILLPVVGTVQSNRRWIEINLHKEIAPVLPAITRQDNAQQQSNEWGELFDQADAAVQLNLRPLPPDQH